MGLSAHLAGEPVVLRLKNTEILRVLVRKDDEAVLRIYKRDEQGPYLEAANEGYKRLRLKEGQIVGVVGSGRGKP